MAILFANDSGWIISHLKFFEKIKVSPALDTSQVLTNDNSKTDSNYRDKNDSFYVGLDPNLFEITEPFKDKIKGKLVQNYANVSLCDTTKVVKDLSDGILNDPQCQKIFQTEMLVGNSNKLKVCEQLEEKSSETEKSEQNANEIVSRSWPKNNITAVNACQHFFEKVKSIELPHFYGENPLADSAVFSTISKNSKIREINTSSPSHQYLFPPETKFYCNSVQNMEKVFEENDETGFDVIIMDPPWWNKFIRRRKRKQHEAGYEMLDDDELAKLPINKLLNVDGIVVVWCTNAKSHQNKLINDIFPRWNVQHQGTLYWLKVTKTGQPICPFNVENKKQPYETIIIGKQTGESCNVNRVVNSSKVIISVPSSINSHKPPLFNILKKMYPDKLFKRKLEIFARYLTPGFISYGNEVVKLQHESLYINLL